MGQNSPENIQEMNSVRGIQLTSLDPFQREEIVQPPMGRRGHQIKPSFGTNYEIRSVRSANRYELSWKKFLRQDQDVRSEAARQR